MKVPKLFDDELMPNEPGPEGFDPTRQVPQTDEQVRHHFSVRPDFDTAVSIWGIYTCERMLGKDVLEAYKAALLTHVGQNL